MVKRLPEEKQWIVFKYVKSSWKMLCITHTEEQAEDIALREGTNKSPCLIKHVKEVRKKKGIT